MGVVYKALDTKLNRQVALKFLPASLNEDKTAKARFIQEAQAASSLDHANICTIFEIGETDEGELFIAMAYYSGQTLKYGLDGSPQSVEDVYSVGRQLSKVLKRAHRAGITHRDIKPANIMVTEDHEVKLLDFGLAKLADGIDLTVVGSTVGTAAYMSPEQMKGAEVGAASDVWSLGAVLYEMATGHKPFVVDYDQALMYAILNEDPKPAQELNPDLPDPLASIIDACLDKNPTTRPTVDVVRDAMGDESSSSRMVAPVAAVSGTIPRNYILVAAAVIVLSLIGVYASGIFGDSAPEESPASFSPALADSKSIAVLPFTYRGGESEDTAVFAGGIHDDILSQLARIDELTVISRTSVLRFENTTKSIAEIAGELGVQNVLEGSVQKAGDRVRVNVSLISAGTGAQLWSQTYDEVLNVENIFAIQTSVAEDIAEQLEAEMTSADRERLNQDANISQEAYDLMTRARYLGSRAQSNEETREAADLFLRVTQLEPEYASAHAALSGTYTSGIRRGIWTERDKAEAASFHADRAMELDPELSWAHMAMANQAWRKLNFDEAERYLLTAIDLDPGNEWPYSSYANFLYQLGRSEESLEYALQALKLDPLSIGMRQRLADLYFFIGDYENTIAESRKILQLEPDDAWSYYNIGYGLALLGRKTEAIASLQKAHELRPEDTDITLGLAWGHANAGDELAAVSLIIDIEDSAANMKEKAIIYGVLGDLDTAFSLLDRAYEIAPSALLIMIGDDSVPEKMRNDRRFKDLAEKLGLELAN